MREQAVLYALSTIAQTCAALVAFIGALGLYRIQTVRAEQALHRATTMRGLVARYRINPGEDAALLPTNEVCDRMQDVISHPRTSAETDEQSRFQAELDKENSYDQDFLRGARMLTYFGGLNLLVILLSLGGFSAVPLLACWWRTFIGLLWAVTLLTVLTSLLMLLEMRDSLALRLRPWRLGRWVLQHLEGAPRAKAYERKA